MELYLKNCLYSLLDEFYLVCILNSAIFTNEQESESTYYTRFIYVYFKLYE